MSGLNEYHRRNLLLAFTRVDELLSQALHDLDPRQAQSPFTRIATDARPEQQRGIADQTARMRARMRAMLERQGIALPERDVSATRAARTAITMAEVAVEELRPRHLRGYGPVPDDAAAEIEDMIAELRLLLGRMNEYLAGGDPSPARPAAPSFAVTSESVARAIEKSLAYVDSRQCRNGGFCFYRTEHLDEPNLCDTYYALAAYRLAGRVVPNRELVRRYLRSLAPCGPRSRCLYYLAGRFQRGGFIFAATSSRR